MTDSVLALTARTIVPMLGEGPARGAGLRAPLKKLDHGLLLIRQGRIEAVGTRRSLSLPPGTAVRDLGDVCLLPGCINAHTHIQLSWLAGRTLWGKGFTPWLSSLIPLLGQADAATVTAATDKACQEMLATGLRHVGDICGSLSQGMAQVEQLCRSQGAGVSHFCEWFGFAPPFVDDQGPWPPRCRAELQAEPALLTGSAPGGHALYSTGPEILQAARAFCRKTGRTFSFHLAESPDETELLTSGSGPLYQCYKDVVLPPDWQAPGQRPLACALRLGLLGPGSMAVHGTQLHREEVLQLGRSGAALCLCPRSNHNLAVGQPPLQDLLESSTLLCLGTDGLTSNTDLDVRQEALWLRERHDLPPEALLRMLTVNGAAALGLPPQAGQLAPGQPARFSLLPASLMG